MIRCKGCGEKKPERQFVWLPDGLHRGDYCFKCRKNGRADRVRAQSRIGNGKRAQVGAPGLGKRA